MSLIRESWFGDQHLSWKLKRLRQCEKCPWKVSTDPRTIPHGYSEEKHRNLASTIAEPGTLTLGKMMACHEHPVDDEVHCIGWIEHQIGRGNNIGLRLHMRDCENGHLIQVDGRQHLTFEDTLPAPDGST